MGRGRFNIMGGDEQDNPFANDGYDDGGYDQDNPFASDGYDEDSNYMDTRQEQPSPRHEWDEDSQTWILKDPGSDYEPPDGSIRQAKEPEWDYNKGRYTGNAPKIDYEGTKIRPTKDDPNWGSGKTGEFLDEHLRWTGDDKPPAFSFKGAMEREYGPFLPETQEEHDKFAENWEKELQGTKTTDSSYVPESMEPKVMHESTLDDPGPEMAPSHTPGEYRKRYAESESFDKDIKAVDQRMASDPAIGQEPDGVFERAIAPVIHRNEYQYKSADEFDEAGKGKQLEYLFKDTPQSYAEGDVPDYSQFIERAKQHNYSSKTIRNFLDASKLADVPTAPTGGGTWGLPAEMARAGARGISLGMAGEARAYQWITPEHMAAEEATFKKMSGDIDRYVRANPQLFEASDKHKDRAWYNPARILVDTPEMVGRMLPGMLLPGGIAFLFFGDMAQTFHNRLTKEKPDMPENEKMAYSIAEGFVQGAVEKLQTMFPGHVFGKMIPGSTKKDILRMAAGMSETKMGKIFGAILTSFVGEMGMETGQDAGSTQIEYMAGLSEQGINAEEVVEGMKHNTGALLGTSLFFGLPSLAKNPAKRKRIADVLLAGSDQTTVETRKLALNELYNAVAAEDKELADLWVKEAIIPVMFNLPVAIPTDSRYDGQRTTPAEEQTPRAKRAALKEKADAKEVDLAGEGTAPVETEESVTAEAPLDTAAQIKILKDLAASPAMAGQKDILEEEIRILENGENTPESDAAVAELLGGLQEGIEKIKSLRREDEKAEEVGIGMEGVQARKDKAAAKLEAENKALNKTFKEQGQEPKTETQGERLDTNEIAKAVDAEIQEDAKIGAIGAQMGRNRKAGKGWLIQTDPETGDFYNKQGSNLSHELGHAVDYTVGLAGKVTNNILTEIRLLWNNFTETDMGGFVDSKTREEIEATNPEILKTIQETFNDPNHSNVSENTHSHEEMFAEAIRQIIENPTESKKVAPELWALLVENGIPLDGKTGQAQETKTDHTKDTDFAAAEAQQRKQDMDARPSPTSTEGRPAAPKGEAQNPINLEGTQEEKVDQLMALSEPNVPIVQGIIDTLKSQFGIVGELNHKKRDGILKKANRPAILANKPWFNVEHVRDSFRFKAMADTFEDFAKIAKTIVNTPGVKVLKMDHEMMMSPKSWGWRVTAIDLEMPNGQIVEFYMPFTEMNTANMDGMHDLFEKWRYRSEEEINADPQMKKDYLAALRESKETYAVAYQAALDRLGLDDKAAAASWAKVETFLESVTLSQSSSSASGPTIPSAQTPSDKTAEKSSSKTKKDSESKRDEKTSGSAIENTSEKVDTDIVPSEEGEVKPGPLVSYRSGANRTADFKGQAKGDVPSGVVAQNLPKGTIAEMAKSAAKGVRTFVDSGAFTAFKKGGRVAFDKVLETYDTIVEATKGVTTLVGTDVIGDQAASTMLTKQYAKKLKGYIDAGVDLIMPVQTGEKTALEVIREYKEILGTDNFRVGFPSNVEAMPNDQIIEVLESGEVGKIHFLGMSPVTRLKAGKQKLDMREDFPNVDYTFDSNRIASKVGKGKKGGITEKERKPSSSTVSDIAEDMTWDEVQEESQDPDTELGEAMHRETMESIGQVPTMSIEELEESDPEAYEGYWDAIGDTYNKLKNEFQNKRISEEGGAVKKAAAKGAAKSGLPQWIKQRIRTGAVAETAKDTDPRTGDKFSVAEAPEADRPEFDPDKIESVDLREAVKQGLLSQDEASIIDAVLNSFPESTAQQWLDHFSVRVSGQTFAPTKDQKKAHGMSDKDAKKTRVEGVLLTEQDQAGLKQDAKHIAVLFEGASVDTFFHEFGEFVYDRLLVGKGEKGTSVTVASEELQEARKVRNAAKRADTGTKTKPKESTPETKAAFDEAQAKVDVLDAALKEQQKIEKKESAVSADSTIVNTAYKAYKKKQEAAGEQAKLKNEWFSDSFRDWWMGHLQGESTIIEPEVQGIFRKIVAAIKNLAEKFKSMGKKNPLDELFQDIITNGRDINTKYYHSSKEAVTRWIIGTDPTQSYADDQGFAGNGKTLWSWDPGTICPKKRRFLDWVISNELGVSVEELREVPAESPIWDDLKSPDFWEKAYQNAVQHDIAWRMGAKTFAHTDSTKKKPVDKPVGDTVIDPPCSYCYVEQARAVAVRMETQTRKISDITATALAKPVWETTEYKDKILNFSKKKIKELNDRGGIRMFAFGDYVRGANKESVELFLKHAEQVGLEVKAITKNPEFVEDFGDSWVSVINVSIDAASDGSLGGMQWDTAAELKKKYPDVVRVRTVALNMAAYDKFARMSWENIDNFVDVITPYHHDDSNKPLPAGVTEKKGFGFRLNDKGEIIGINPESNKLVKFIKDNPDLNLDQRTCCLVGGKCFHKGHQKQCAAVCGKEAPQGQQLSGFPEEMPKTDPPASIGIVPDEGTPVDTSVTLKTKKGSPIKRGGGKFSIGKWISGQLYIHKDFAASQISEKVLNKALKSLPKDFSWETLSYDPKTGWIRFQEVPGFNTEREPKVTKTVTVFPDGTTSKVVTPKTPKILHHKWQWVNDTYTGFDVQESYEWSKEWMDKWNLEKWADGNSQRGWDAQLSKVGLPVDKSVKFAKVHSPEILALTEDSTMDEMLTAGVNPGATQIPRTLSLYEKSVDFFNEIGAETVLDVGAGLGLGTKAMQDGGLQAESVEPFPDTEKIESGDAFAPTYDSFEGVEGQYDGVINQYVLNVIAKDARDSLVRFIGSAIKPGGTGVIITRGNDVKGKPVVDFGPLHMITMNRGQYTYQKGFQQQELIDYVQEILGDGFVVSKHTGSNTSSPKVKIERKKGTKFAMVEGDAANLDKAFAKTSKPAKSKASLLEKAIDTILTARGRRNMKINVVQSVSDLTVDGVQLTAKDGSVAGMFDPSTGEITLVADNVSEADAWKYTLHEGAHKVVDEKGWSGLFRKKAPAILKDIKAKIKAGKKKGATPSDKRWAAAEAKAKAAGTVEADMFEETVTYFLADHANANQNLWRRIVNAIRSWAVNVGIRRKISDADIVAMAEHRIQQRARAQKGKGRIAEGTQKLSKALEEFATWTSARIKNEIQRSAFPKGKTKAVVAWVDPMAFLNATTEEGGMRDRVKAKVKPLDVEKMKKNDQTPYLVIGKDGEILDHEGRHRLVALADAGVKHVPIVLHYEGRPELRQESDGMVHRGQEFYDYDTKKTAFGNSLSTMGHIPLAHGNLSRIEEEMDVQGIKFTKGPQQFKAVDIASKAFKKWFGKSKVVDADGKPLRVFHVTSEDFDKFEAGHGPERGGLLAFFAEDSGFGGDHMGDKVYPVYLKIEKLLDFETNAQDVAFDFIDHVGTIENLDSWELERIVDTLDIPADYKEENIDINEYFIDEVGRGNWQVFEIDSFLDFARSQGYEGVRMVENESVTYAVFEPTQIKSATTNTGEFSNEDPRIMYSKDPAADKVLEGFNAERGTGVIYQGLDSVFDPPRHTITDWGADSPTGGSTMHIEGEFTAEAVQKKHDEKAKQYETGTVDSEGNTHFPDIDEGVIFLGGDMVDVDFQGNRSPEGIRYAETAAAWTASKNVVTAVENKSKQTYKTVAIVAYPNVLNSMLVNPIFHAALERSMNESYGEKYTQQLLSEVAAEYVEEYDAKVIADAKHAAAKDKWTADRKAWAKKNGKKVDEYTVKPPQPPAAIPFSSIQKTIKIQPLKSANAEQLKEGRKTVQMLRDEGVIPPEATGTRVYMTRVAASIAVKDHLEIAGKVIGVGRYKSREDVTAENTDGGDLYTDRIHFEHFHRFDEPVAFKDIVDNLKTMHAGKSEMTEGRKMGAWLTMRNGAFWLNKRESDVIPAMIAAGNAPKELVSDLTDGKQSSIKFAKVPETPVSEFHEENMRIKDQHRSLWDKAKAMLRRQFTPAGNLPGDTFNAMILRDGAFKSTEFDIGRLIIPLEKAVKEEYGKTFDDLTDKQLAALSEALSGAVTGIKKPKTLQAIVMLRQFIDQQSSEYIKMLQKQVAHMTRDFNEGDHILLEAFADVDNLYDSMPGKTPAEKAKRTKEKNRIMKIARDAAKKVWGSGKGMQEALGRVADVGAKIRTINTISGNLGEYVHRSYKAFDDPKWRNKVDEKVIDAARAHLVERYMERDEEMDTKEAVRLANRAIEKMLATGTAYDNMSAYVRESKLGAKDLSVLKHRKKIAPEIRALLGEYKDPRLNFAKSITKMSRLIHNQIFLDKVLEHGEGVFLFAEKDAVLGATAPISAEGSDVLAPLNGMWTFPEVDQAFKDALGKNNLGDSAIGNMVDAWIKFNGAIKFNKTVASPTTAARNFISAAGFAIANGHFNMKYMVKAAKLRKEYFKKHGDAGRMAYIQKLSRLGVMHDNPYAGEMIRLLEDSNIETMMSGSALSKPFRALVDFAQKFYQYGDDFWKIIGFENEKENLMGTGLFTEAEAEVEAAQRIRQTYPTYSMVGRFFKNLNRVPVVGTFVSFTAEILRTSYNVLDYAAKDIKTPGMESLGRKRIAGMAMVTAAAPVAQMISAMVLGIDDDEEQAIRDLAPPWSKNSNLLFLGRDEDGNMRYLDLSFMDPYAYFKRPINAIMQKKPWADKFMSASWEMISPFMGTEILLDAVVEWTKKRKGTLTGDQIFELLGRLWDSFKPGVLSNLEGFYKAYMGEENRSGKKYNMQDEVLRLVGTRPATLNPRNALKWKAKEFRDDHYNAVKKLGWMMHDRNNVSDDALVREFAKATKNRAEVYKRFSRLVQAALKSGLNEDDVRGLLKGKVSADKVTALIAGDVPPWAGPSDQTKKNALRNEKSLFKEKADTERIEHRYDVIEGVAPPMPDPRYSKSKYKSRYSKPKYK